MQAGTLAEAISALRSTIVDAVIADLNLPDSEGLDTIVELRSIISSTPLIALTGFDDELGVKCIQAGADDFVSKSMLYRDLARTVDFAIHRGRRWRKEANVLMSFFEQEIKDIENDIPVELSVDVYGAFVQFCRGGSRQTLTSSVDTLAGRVVKAELTPDSVVRSFIARESVRISAPSHNNETFTRSFPVFVTEFSMALARSYYVAYRRVQDGLESSGEY